MVPVDHRAIRLMTLNQRIFEGFAQNKAVLGPIRGNQLQPFPGDVAGWQATAVYATQRYDFIGDHANALAMQPELTQPAYSS